MLNSSRGENEGTYRSIEGEKDRPCDPGPDLLMKGSESTARIIDGMKSALHLGLGLFHLRLVF